MPGSANFAAEFLILLGVFRAKVVIAVIAFTGVGMAAVYMLRMFIRAMHNRTGPAVESRELRFMDGAVIAPLVAVIIAFALYPQLALDRSERTVNQSVREARALSAPPDPPLAGVRRLGGPAVTPTPQGTP
jgi:NADH-quinone oxidoreductase subunit M